MSRHDFQVHKSPFGGPAQIKTFPLNASETFRAGEPCSVNADGELTESADDPTLADVMGIAAVDGDTGLTDPFTGSARATSAEIQVIIPIQGTEFRTKNFATDGAGTAATPAKTNIGDEAGFTLASGVWSIDIGTTNNVARILDVLDANGVSINKSGYSGTPTWVVFAITTSQMTGVDAPAA
jgi:hypothetical protein